MLTYRCINWGSCVFHFRWREHTETSHGFGIGISSNWIWLPFLLAISGMAQPQKRHFDVRPHSKHKSWSIPYLVLNRTTSYRIHIKFLKYSSCLLEAIDWIFFYYYYQNATPLNISQTLNYLDKYIIYFVLLHCAGIPPLFYLEITMLATQFWAPVFTKAYTDAWRDRIFSQGNEYLLSTL